MIAVLILIGAMVAGSTSPTSDEGVPSVNL